MDRQACLFGEEFVEVAAAALDVDACLGGELGDAFAFMDRSDHGYQVRCKGSVVPLDCTLSVTGLEAIVGGWSGGATANYVACGLS